MQIVLDHPEKPWDWYDLSRNPNITMQNVIDHPEKPWSWRLLSYDLNMTYKFVVKYSNKIKFGLLSSNRLKRNPVICRRLRAIAKPLVYRTHVNLIPPLAEIVLDFLYGNVN